jgi:hypothetical protein
MTILFLAWNILITVKFKKPSKAGFNSSNQMPGKNHLHEFKHQNKSNKQLQSARISIQLILDSSLIKIRNTGQSDAKNVNIILDGIPIDDYPGIINKKEHNTISAQNSIVIQACVGIEVFPSDFIEITWDDKEAEKKFYRISLYN